MVFVQLYSRNLTIAAPMVFVQLYSRNLTIAAPMVFAQLYSCNLTIAVLWLERCAFAAVATTHCAPDAVTRSTGVK